MKRLLAIVFIVALAVTGCEYGSQSALLMNENSGSDYWNAEYKSLSGYKEKAVSLDEAKEYQFDISVKTESGSFDLSIKGEDGSKYYTGQDIGTADFSVMVSGEAKVYIRIDSSKHDGSYDINWAQTAAD